MDELFYYKNKIYIPKSLRIRVLEIHHNDKKIDHKSLAKTLHLLRRRYYWPNLRQKAQNYIQNYQICQHAKSNTHKIYDHLQPLPTPSERWKRIRLNIITDLPKTAKNNIYILDFVDHLTKIIHLRAIPKILRTKKTAEKFETVV